MNHPNEIGLRPIPAFSDVAATEKFLNGPAPEDTIYGRRSPVSEAILIGKPRLLNNWTP